MKLEVEHNNYRMYSVDKQAFMNVKQNIPTHIRQWKLMFINSKENVVFYREERNASSSNNQDKP